jgi:hypothetical protein
MLRLSGTEKSSSLSHHFFIGAINITSSLPCKPDTSIRSTDRQNVYASLCLLPSISIFIRGRSPSGQCSELFTLWLRLKD